MIQRLKKVDQLTRRLHQNLHSRYSQGNQLGNFPKPKIITNVFHEKAYLASGFMRIIENPIHPIRKISLKNQLKDFLEDDKLTSNDSKLQLRKLIDGGVEYDSNVFSQYRMIIGSSNSLITFHPTTTVTGDMFRNIKQNLNTQLIVGHFGISKTFSMAFYQKLANYIIDYRMRTNPEQVDESIKRVKKLFYWSIDKDRFTKQQIDELIQRQFSPSQIQFLTALNFKDQKAWKKLHDLYNQRGIKTLLTIDAINILYGMVRQTEYTMKQRESKDSKFQKIMSFQNIIVQKLSQFQQIIYLSSMNIEDWLLGQIQLMKEPKQMRKPVVKILDFQGQLKTEQVRIELIDFFIEAYDNFFKSQVDKLISNEVGCVFKNRRQFYQHLREQIFQIWKDNEDFYITQLVIQKYIKQIENQNLGFEQNVETTMELKKRLIQFFSQLIEYKMPQMLSEITQNFFEKSNDSNNENKLYLMTEIYNKYSKLRNLGKPLPAQINVTKSEIENISDDKYKKLIKVLERHIFSVKNNEIVLMIPPKVFMKLEFGENNQKKSIMKYVVEQFSKYQKQNLEKISNNSSLGINLQNNMKIILTYGNSSFVIMDNKSQNVIKEFKSIEKQTGGFKVLQSTQTYDFIENIKEYLTFMIEKSTKQNKSEVNQLFFPVLKGTEVAKDHTYQSMKSSIHETSKAIDFIIVNYNRKKKKFQINAFDVTVQKGNLIIGQKVQKFLDGFINLKNNKKNSVTIGDKNYKVQLNYYTITPQTNFDDVNGQLSLILKPYKSFKFKKSSDDRVAFSRRSATSNNFLRQIGHLSFSKNMQITNEESETSVDFGVYQALLKWVCRDQEQN